MGEAAGEDGILVPDLFVEGRFPKGHRFLTEGINSLGPTLFIVKTGVVEFRRCEDDQKDPVHKLRTSNIPTASAWSDLPRQEDTFDAVNKLELFCSLKFLDIEG